MVPFDVVPARKRESNWPTSTGHSASRGLHPQNFLCQETASQMFKAAAGPPGARSKTHFDQGLRGCEACALFHSAATHVLAGLLSTGMMLIYRMSLWSGHCQRHWRHGNGQAASILAKGKPLSLVFIFYTAVCLDQVFKPITSGKLTQPKANPHVLHQPSMPFECLRKIFWSSASFTPCQRVCIKQASEYAASLLQLSPELTVTLLECIAAAAAAGQGMINASN